MEQTEDTGLRHESPSGVQISRRTLLKTLGATTLGTIAATLPVPSYFTIAASATAANPSDAWAIAAASPILHRGLDHLKTYGFEFTLERTRFEYVGEKSPLIGLRLRQTGTLSRRTGADLLCTVDLDARKLVGVQYVIGACQDCSLEAQSVILNEQSLRSSYISTRDSTIEQPGPSRYDSWSYARSIADLPPPPDLLLPSQGWPPDVISPWYWYYKGCERTEWTADSPPILRCSEIVEARSSEPADQRRFTLVYLSYTNVLDMSEPVRAINDLSA